MQLNSVPAKDQTGIAADWIVRADQNPRGFELDTGVLLAQADLTIHTATVFFPVCDIGRAHTTEDRR